MSDCLYANALAFTIGLQSEALSNVSQQLALETYGKSKGDPRFAPGGRRVPPLCLPYVYSATRLPPRDTSISVSPFQDALPYILRARPFLPRGGTTLRA